MSNPAVHAGLGLVLIVVFVSLYLSGIVASQATTFYTNFHNDRLWIKLFVAWLIFVDLLSTLEACSWQFDVLVQNWGNPNAIAKPNKILALNPACIGLMAVSVQTFFTWRLYKITKSLALTVLVGACTLTAFVGAIGTCVWAISTPTFHMNSPLKPLGAVWLVSSVVTDALITVAVSYTLAKRKGEFENTNFVLNRIIRLTVQNGLLTTAAALTDLALFIAIGSPTHTVSFVLPKLYASSVLMSLNSRSILRGSDSSWAMSRMEDAGSDPGDPFSRGRRMTARASQMPATRRKTAAADLAIQIHTERSEVTETHKPADWAESHLHPHFVEESDVLSQDSFSANAA